MTDQAAAADLLDVAVDHAVAALRQYTAGDWTGPMAELDGTVNETVHHAAEAMFRYAVKLVLQPKDPALPFLLSTEPDTDPRGMVDLVVAGGAVLASLVRTVSPDVRGWHIYGTSDPVGFAAMGIVETLVHTHDVALTFGGPFTLPAAPSAFAVERLFPDAPDGDPADVLLWCAGRAPLGELARRTQWRWDGTVRR